METSADRAARAAKNNSEWKAFVDQYLAETGEGGHRWEKRYNGEICCEICWLKQDAFRESYYHRHTPLTCEREMRRRRWVSLERSFSSPVITEDVQGRRWAHVGGVGGGCISARHHDEIREAEGEAGWQELLKLREEFAR